MKPKYKLKKNQRMNRHGYIPDERSQFPVERQYLCEITGRLVNVYASTSIQVAAFQIANPNHSLACGPASAKRGFTDGG